MKRLPVVLQSEVAECGLACLAMISSAYGRQIDLGSLRQRFPISMNGASLRRCLAIADALGLGTRVLQVEPEQLRHLQCPAMLHWDLNHFVVLKKANRRRIVLHDPDSGEIAMTVAAAGRHLTGIAVEFFPTESLEKVDERRPVRLTDLVRFDSRYLLRLGGLVGLALLALTLTIAQPYYFQLLIDRVVPTLDFDLLNVLALGFGALIVLNWIAKTIRTELSLRLGFVLSAAMSERLFGRLMRLPLSFFENRNTGDLITKFDAVKEIRTILTEDSARLLVDLIVVISTGFILARYSLLLFGVCLAFTGTYLVLRLLTYRRLRLLNEESFRRQVRERNHFIETVHGMLSIKTQTAEAQRFAAWRSLFRSAGVSGVEVARQRLGYDLTRDGLLALESVVALAVATRLLIAQQLTLGMLFAYLAYRQFFTQSAMSFLETSFRAVILRIQLDRLADLVHHEEEPPKSDRAIASPLAPSLAVESLSFRYEEEGPYILRDLSFRIGRGQRVALTGPSGCGKTTLVKLILGLLDGYEGSIQLRGIEVGRSSRQTLLDGVGVVMQADRLFAGSIANNIAFFDPTPDAERIEEAARGACIHDTLTQLPMGYETRIGDLGSVLSAGQMQRLMLARALYRRPEILVLDEGTANLDEATEREILDNIAQRQITVIHAAHRASVILDADLRIDLAGPRPRRQDPLPAAAG